MVASVGVMVLNVHVPAASVMSEIPIPTDVMAIAIGRLMATALPSMISRITIATPMPISSLVLVPGGWALSITAPPNSTCTPPAAAAARAWSSMLRTDAVSTSTAGVENWASA